MDKAAPCRCTMVVPCYNEESRLKLEVFRGFVDPAGHTVRFLLVNDGSTDETGRLLDSLHDAQPERFEALHLSRNSGKAEAVRQGILQALESSPDAVGFWDADLSTPLSAIAEFLDVLDNHPSVQIVLGSRVRLLGRRVERPPVRHFLGRMFATAASLVLRLPVYDTQCGAKLFRMNPDLRSLFAKPFCSRWLFDVEVLARFKKACGDDAQLTQRQICELPLREWRHVGASKVGPLAFPKAFWELMVIYWKYRRRPTRA